MGQGFDRHLMGLRVQAEREGRTAPAIYDDETYEFTAANTFHHIT